MLGIKIVSDDNPIFLGLISDLFPSLDVPRKRDLEFEKAVKHAACDLKLQPEESFVMKVVQLEQLSFHGEAILPPGPLCRGCRGGKSRRRSPPASYSCPRSWDRTRPRSDSGSAG